MCRQAVCPGVKSIRAVQTDIGNTYKGDYEQMLKEKEEKLALEAKYRAISNSNAEKNPSEPGITNEAENKPQKK